MGRPPIPLTIELQTAICRTLALGVSREVAFQREGVSPATVYRWMARGRDEGQEPYASFVAAIEAAEAQVEVEVTQGILRAAKDDWRAAAFWLRWRKLGGREVLEVSGPGGQPLGVITSETADSIRRTILFGESSDTQPAGALPADTRGKDEP